MTISRATALRLLARDRYCLVNYFAIAALAGDDAAKEYLRAVPDGMNMLRTEKIAGLLWRYEEAARILLGTRSSLTKPLLVARFESHDRPTETVEPRFIFCTTCPGHVARVNGFIGACDMRWFRLMPGVRVIRRRRGDKAYPDTIGEVVVVPPVSVARNGSEWVVENAGW